MDSVQMFSEKGREFVPWDQVHAVVEINVAGVGNDVEFLRF